MFPLLHKLGRGAEVRRGLRGIALHKSAAGYITYPLQGWEFDASKISFGLSCWPTFAKNDGVNHTFLDSTSSVRYLILKDTSNNLRVFAGGTQVLLCSYASWSSYWQDYSKNELLAVVESGDNRLYLNGTEICSSATAWTAGEPTEFFVGSRYDGTNNFQGTIGAVKIFRNALLTETEHDAYYNGTMWDYLDDATAIYPMRMAEHDPTNSRTLDVRGNGNHATFEGTPTKRSERGYVLDGSSNFNSGDVGDFDNDEKQSFFVLGRFTDVASLQGIVSKSLGGGTLEGWQMYLQSNTVKFRICENGTSTGLRVSCNAAGLLAQLSSLGFTYDGSGSASGAQIYLNGKACSMATELDAGFSGSTLNNADLVIGRLSYGFTQRLSGGSQILGTAQYDRALNPIQVADLHARLMRSIHDV